MSKRQWTSRTVIDVVGTAGSTVLSDAEYLYAAAYEN